MGMSDLLARLASGAPATPVTPCNLDGVSPETASEQARTPVTPVTPKIDKAEGDARLPANLADVAARVCLWRIPGEPARFVVAGPDHDLREQYLDAVPMFDEAHRDRVRRLPGRRGQCPDGTAESLAERAAILEHEAGESREDAQRIAVRLVQCRRCAHFAPDPARPSTGIGACAVQGWPQAEGREQPCHDEVPSCHLFGPTP